MAPAVTPLIVKSEALQHIMGMIAQIAPTNVSALIQGESGTGKEMIARAIHAQSLRKDKAFIAVNCGALPETTLESELFGHEKGAFTDAREQRKGRFELANGGTLFLDEIGEMNVNVQVKFLRILEDGEVMRLGGNKPIKTDVRIITATNKNLETAVGNGEFRKDLYYRIKVIEIKIPPLRERKDDIQPLIDVFVKDFCETNNLDFPGFTVEAIEAFLNYSWPGNIRELHNLIKNLIILNPSQKVTLENIPRYVLEEKREDQANLPIRLNKTADQAERELIYRAILELKKDFEDIKTILQKNYTEQKSNTASQNASLENTERELIKKILEETRFNKKQAAKKLGIGQRTIYRKIKKYNLD